jgi:hypothetical protein
VVVELSRAAGARRPAAVPRHGMVSGRTARHVGGAARGAGHHRCDPSLWHGRGELSRRRCWPRRSQARSSPT